VTLQPSDRARRPIKSLADFCPCDSVRIESFRRTGRINLGSAPSLSRIYDATSWDLFAPRAFWWKLRSFFSDVDIDWIQSDADRHRWQVDGWAVPEDWTSGSERGCAPLGFWYVHRGMKVYL
jgi:hypothetical protein